jgi:hypothetical protein
MENLSASNFVFFVRFVAILGRPASATTRKAVDAAKSRI